MYRLKYLVTKMNDAICIIQPKYRYKRYIAIRYRALLSTASIFFILTIPDICVGEPMMAPSLRIHDLQLDIFTMYI